MSNCKDIKFCVVEMLSNSATKIYPKDKAKIINILTKYIDILIFNIVAVACVICLRLGMKKLLKEHVVHLQKYIDKRCCIKRSATYSSMKGGAFNTAAFYGVNEPQYSTTNATTDVMNVDWVNNLARPRLNMTMFGGMKHCNKLNSIIFKKISNIFKFFRVKATKSIIKDFVEIYNNHVHELFLNLEKSKKEISANKLLSIIKKSKILKNDT